MTVTAGSVTEHRPAAVFALPGAVDIVRRALATITEENRPRLWERLEALDRALLCDNAGFVDHVVNRAPAGPIRLCLAELANRRRPGRPPTRSEPAGPLRHPRRQYKELHAMCCPTDAWASTGVKWLSADPDTFYGIDTNRFRHRPVSLLWRHRDGEPIGLSRRWWLDDDGSLCGEFFVPSLPLAQVAADLANQRAVAPSVGVRFDSRWTFTDPSEWDPYTGRVDLCRHVNADVQEVSLTPTPQLPTRVLSVR
jgi:hypothetical protein